MQPRKHVPNVALGIMGMQFYGLGIPSRSTFGEGLNKLTHENGSSGDGILINDISTIFFV